MASSFFALLDDIAVLARAAAASVDDVLAGAGAASAKATGVVIDDAAVTPQYVQGISPKRELPVVWRIARGSLLNKGLIIAAILPLSIFLPAALPWLLILGGTYLAYEGAEKAWQWWASRRDAAVDAREVIERTAADEDQIVRAALRTDVVLSAEIMLISLAAIASDSWVMELAILLVVAVTMTVGVYAAVGLLIKLDDVGAWLRRRPARAAKRVGTMLIRAMPKVFSLLTIVGVLAMLWIGGQILIENLAHIGWTGPHAALASVTGAITGAPAFAWSIGTVISMIIGFGWGSAMTGVVTAAGWMRRRRTAGV